MLAFAIILPFSSCTHTPTITQTGIHLTSGTPLSVQDLDPKSLENTKNTVFDLLAYFVTRTTTQNLTENTVTLLKEHAAAVTEILIASVSTKTRLDDLAAMINTHGHAAIDAYLDPNNTDKGALRTLYLDLSTLMGSDRLGKLAYSLTLYRLEDLAATARERYQKYGYTYLLDEALAHEANINTLKNEIGAESFSVALRLAVIGTDLFLLSGSDASLLSDFSAAEILAFLKHLPLTGFTITAKGWQLLLSLAAPKSPATFAQKLLFTAQGNGDITLICTEINSLLSLLASAQSRLDTEATVFLQNGNTSALLYTLFHRFSQEEQEELLRLTTLPLKHDDYEELALSTFGDSYTAYKETITKTTWTDLKSATQDTFATTLHAYLQTNFPALFYVNEQAPST